MNTFQKLIALLASAGVASCAVKESTLEQASTRERESHPRSGIVVIPKSKSRQKIEQRLMADYDYIMMDHIGMENGRMVLLLTEELAKKMQIPDAVYQKYQRYVQEYNDKNTVR